MATSEQCSVTIVGCGNAGSVLAARLTKDPPLKVLVLEAGADHATNQMVHVSTAGMTLWPDTLINWAFKTVPQEGYGARLIEHHCGKGLGGTRPINLNCITFPDRGSINSFARIRNVWAYDELQPHYREFHTFHEPNAGAIESLGLDCLDESLHGKSGPIQVSFGNFHGDVSRVWSRTLKALGWESITDPQSGDAIGSVNAPGSVDPQRTRVALRRQAT